MENKFIVMIISTLAIIIVIISGVDALHTPVVKNPPQKLLISQARTITIQEPSKVEGRLVELTPTMVESFGNVGMAKAVPIERLKDGKQ